MYVTTNVAPSFAVIHVVEIKWSERPSVILRLYKRKKVFIIIFAILSRILANYPLSNVSAEKTIIALHTHYLSITIRNPVLIIFVYF